MVAKLKKMILWLIVGLVAAIWVVVQGFNKGYGWSHVLCDGFLIAAVLLLALGGLKYVRNQGLFDLFGYTFSNLFRSRSSEEMGVPLSGKKETFEEYKTRKKETRKSAGPLLWSGLVYLALSGIMMAIYLVTA